jgi:hypothetical protein
LLRGVREIAQDRRDAGGPQPEQIEPHVLHRQHTRFDLLFHPTPTRKKIAQCLALALEQVDLPIALTALFVLSHRLDA